jgi:hypothetical protein
LNPDRKGMAAAVYTETTDVEIEINGFLTYTGSLKKWMLTAWPKFTRN